MYVVKYLYIVAYDVIARGEGWGWSQSPDRVIYTFESKRFIDCLYWTNVWEIQIWNSYKSNSSRFPQTWHWRGAPPSYQILISFSNLWLKYLYDWFYFQEPFEKNRAQVPPKNPCIFRRRAKSKMAASTNLKHYLKDITFEPEHIDSYVKTLFWINRPRGLRLWHHFDVWTSFWYKNPRWPPYEWFPFNLRESWLVPYVEQEMLTISGTSDYIT